MHTIAAYALRDITEIAALGAFLIIDCIHRARHRLVNSRAIFIHRPVPAELLDHARPRLRQ